MAAGTQMRRARLAVPELELGQQVSQAGLRVGVGHALGKVIAGHGLAVKALKVQLHAFGKAIAAHQGLHHAHDLGTFFVNGDGVEVVDFDVAVGSYRVRHGAGVLGELGGAQHTHVLDALDRAGRCVATQVLAEFLVAEHGQAFLQAQLEPVAAGDAVAGPVVEVFVTHHALDVGVVHIGRSGLVGQHVLGVEDVQALVLHGTHVEVAGGNNHEAFQVQRQSKAGLVPGHRGHEAVHCVFGLVQIAGAHKHLQQVVFAGAAGNALLARHQLACHQGKQVGRLLVRVDPLGKVAAVFQRTAVHQIAVGQQHRVLGFVGTQRDRVAGHHIGAVQEVGDAAKAFGLALGEERFLADVQAGQLGVLDGRTGGEDFQRERFVSFGQVFQHQAFAFHLEGGALTVDQHAGQVQFLTVQFERLGRDIRVAAQCHLVQDAGFGRIQIKTQIDGVNPERGGAVVGAVDHGGVAFSGHRQTPCFREASINTSRSPSSTFCVAETSTLVRRSLMRLLSST